MMGNPVTINDKDLVLISMYLDEKLNADETTRLEARRRSDSAFNEMVTGMAYARRMLRLLPQKRAPRNFTLSPERYAKPVRTPWLQPALSFVSVAAAVALVVVYAGGSLLGSQRAASPAAFAPEAAMLESASDQAVEPTLQPLIIWDPVDSGGGGQDLAYGKGGGPGGAGGPGFVVEEPMPELSPIATEEPPPMLTAPEAAASGDASGEDLNSLILGIPEEQTRGKFLDSNGERTRQAAFSLSMRNILMILSGGLALLAGIGAFLLRRR